MSRRTISLWLFCIASASAELLHVMFGFESRRRMTLTCPWKLAIVSGVSGVHMYVCIHIYDVHILFVYYYLKSHVKEKYDGKYMYDGKLLSTQDLEESHSSNIMQPLYKRRVWWSWVEVVVRRVAKGLSWWCRNEYM